MGDAANVKMGVCNVKFGEVDLGYTSGGVSISYSGTVTEKKVDQEDAPIGQVVTEQKFEVKVPLAEYDLTKLATLLPGATLVTDGLKKRLELSGASGTDLSSLAKVLRLTPVDGDENDGVTLYYAAPQASISYKYEKSNIRVFEVTFTALKGILGWVALGDASAVVAP